jgi:hypothetical protein
MNIDPLTKEHFTPKRSNQKFANRENQIKYNNQLAKLKRKEKAYVHSVLHTNWKILKELLGRQEEVVKSKDYMLGAGYTFGCHTHIREVKSIKWNMVYNYGYTTTNTRNNFKIKKL